jgi:hypothetical protein
MKKCLALCFGLFTLLALPGVSLAEPGTPPPAMVEQPQTDLTPPVLTELGIPQWLDTFHCTQTNPCLAFVCECAHACEVCGVKKVTCGPTWVCECNDCG